jgi:hypothetical protein
MLDNPIKFPSSPSSSEDEKLSHHSSDKDISSDWMPSDCSPSRSDEKDPEEEEDKDEEDDADADADDDADDADDSDSDLPPPKLAK